MAAAAQRVASRSSFKLSCRRSGQSETASGPRCAPAMPLVLDDDPSKSAVGFDVQSATTLFWKPVPVLLRQTEREDQLEELTFRILTGFARQNHNLRVSMLRMGRGRRRLHGARQQCST